MRSPKHHQIKPQEWMESPASAYVFGILHKQGGKAQFVGGCVRDALLERPVQDIDIASTHHPEAAVKLLEGAGVKTFPTGIDHGTITAVCDDRAGISRFEITTLRRDEACDGRHAEVAFTDSWEEDAKRRDFTMNALYATLEGEITDYFGGVEDAQAGRVRFIGVPQDRIREDALRILRFFRFFAHYGTLPMDEAGLAACAELASMIQNLSGERIQAEMLKLLTCSQPADILQVMDAQGVLAPLGLTITADALGALDFLPQIEMDGSQPIRPIRRLALILRQMPHPAEAAKRVAGAWKLSGQKRDELAALVSAGLEGMESWHQAAVKREIRQFGAAVFTEMVLVGWAEFLTRHADREREARDVFAPMISFAENWVIPEFPLKGRDLQALGVAEGPDMGRLLQALERFWEEQDYHPDKPVLLDHARTLITQEN